MNASGHALIGVLSAAFTMFLIRFKEMCMAPGSHLVFSWLVAVNVLRDRRERSIVALVGVAPDIDGMGVIIDKISGSTNYYAQYHHVVGHGIFSAILFAAIAALLAKVQKLTVFCLSFFVMHLHILCDIVGSKGPDGYQWPIYYLFPLNQAFGITWPHQWALNAWQNVLFMVLLLFVSGYYAATRKITFLEVFSERLNAEAFKMYARYFAKKHG